MQVGLRHFDWRTLEWLAGALRAGGRSRHALCREPVGRTGWRNARGGPCIPAAAKALPALAERVGEALPEVRAAPDPYAAPAVPAGAVPDTAVACALGEPGPVRPGAVGGADDRRLWEAMVERHHPRGWARPPGGQLRYWVRPERHGVLGGIGFGSATWRPAARDAWIGWSADARAANIARVVRCHRFPVLPGVRVYGLAPEVPPMAAARVADGWEARYSVRPVAIYTHVGPEHSGHSLHRAGWTCAGHGSGRRSAAGTAPEDGWREALTRRGRRPVGALAGAYDGMKMDWAEREYGRSGHTDGRVRRRIAGMGRAWLENMGEDLPVVLPTKAAKKAAYRLLSNRRVTMEHILQPHHEATADRCRDESLILAIQDTTTLNQPALEATTGLAKLVRASRSVRQRVRAEGGEDVCLWEHAASLPALAAVDLTVPASGGPGASRERTARLEIRAAEVAVLPPKRGCGTEPLTMFAVSATGTDVDDGEEPLHWLLLTTERPAEGQPDSMHALTVLDWYRRRWTVQTWFRTLKSGTRSRDRRLDTADGPPRCLAFDAVTACPVADITMLARERPDTPATEACPEEDIRLPLTLLSAQGHREVTTMADGTPPDIRTFVIDLGRLVGAHPRRRQPLPGVKKVWQGLERLNWAIQVRNALGRGPPTDALGERRREWDRPYKCGLL